MFWPPSLIVKLYHERVGWIVPDDRGVGHAGTRRAGGGRPDVVRGRDDEQLLRLGDLASQGIGRIALALPSEGSLPHTPRGQRGRW